MKVHGACHCGAVAYEAEIDPARVTVCHCNDCQSFSGAPFRASVPAKAEEEDPFTWYQVAKAYSMLQNLPMADLATAESNYVVGEMPKAVIFASRARAKLPQGGLDWQRANDIIAAASAAARQRR